jgi:hypothetical protein
MIKIVARHYRVQRVAHDATCLFGADIDGRRVLNSDNNHLSGTIARCINRVLSPDINDKRRSLARSGHSILPRSFYRSHSRSFNERIRLQTLPLFFFQTKYLTGARRRIYLSTYYNLEQKKYFVVSVSLPLLIFSDSRFV